MEHAEVVRLLTGNGDVTKGLLWRHEELSQKVEAMEKTLESLEKVSKENHTMLKTMLGGKRDKPFLGISPETWSKIWLVSNRAIISALAAKLGIDFVVQ